MSDQVNNKTALLDGDAKVAIDRIVIEGQGRSQLSLFTRLFQETSLPIRIPSSSSGIDESTTTSESIGSGGKKSVSLVERFKQRGTTSTTATATTATASPIPPPIVSTTTGEPSNTITTIAELHSSLSQVTGKLLSMDLFEYVDSHLDLVQYDNASQTYQVKYISIHL